MKNVFILSLVLLTCSPFFLGAQTNAFLDGFLKSEKAQAGESVYLVLMSNAMVPETGTVDNALDALKGKNWNLGFKDKTTAITLGEFSYLIMKTFGMGGGLMYSLFPGPRYAGRELVYLGFIKGDPNPGRSISGREAFSILRLVLDSREGA